MTVAWLFALFWTADSHNAQQKFDSQRKERDSKFVGKSKQRKPERAIFLLWFTVNVLESYIQMEKVKNKI